MLSLSLSVFVSYFLSVSLSLYFSLLPLPCIANMHLSLHTYIHVREWKFPVLDRIMHRLEQETAKQSNDD